MSKISHNTIPLVLLIEDYTNIIAVLTDESSVLIKLNIILTIIIHNIMFKYI